MTDNLRYSRLVLIMTLNFAICGHGRAMQSAGIDDSIPRPHLIEPLELPVIDGTRIRIEKPTDSKLTVVCFLGTECPLAKLYSVELQKISDEFAAKQIRVVGISSNLQDSIAELVEFASKHGITFPIAKDYDNVVADQFGAQRTPEVFLLDHQLQIRYRGRIDDQYTPGVARSKPSRADLRIAIDEILQGRPVSLAETEVAGCVIGRVKHRSNSEVTDSNVTYANQIARVFQQHCVECHRPGEIGPFSLTEYDEAIGWAEMIVEVVEQGRMPPWHASDQHVELLNRRVMPESDKQLLRDWLAVGAPHGDPNELPKPRKFVEGWRLPTTPDLVIEMSSRPFLVPPDGTVEYQYFVVDPGFEEERWVSAAEVVPGNRAVVHHSIVFVRAPDGTLQRGSGWIGAYVPGQGNFRFPDGHARRIPAGSKLVFQQHYTPVGTPQSDMTKVGIIFAEPGQVTHEVMTLIGIDQEFEIPPHAEDYRVDLRVPGLPKNGRLLSVAPHMHWRGKSFDLYAVSAGQRQHLLEVPRYDFNWQHNYRFQVPIALDAVDSLEFTVSFDNSKNNPANPDPSQYVTWGDQTWEEMAIAFFEVARPIAGDGLTQHNQDPALTEAELGANKLREQQLETQANRLADDFFARLDKNRDGLITPIETPRAFRRFGFWRFDSNSDDKLSRDEVKNFALAEVKSKK